MGKDSPSPPPAPDYTAAAQAQGAANLTSAQQGAVLSNPNVYSPYGSQSVSYSPLGGSDPSTANFLSPTISQTLNPQSQQIFDAQQAARLGLANLGQQGISTAQGALGQPFNFSGPSVQTSLGPQQAPQNAPDLFGFGQAGANVPAGQGMAETPNILGMSASGSVANPALQNSLAASPATQNTLDLSGVAKMPVNAGNTAYQAIMSRLDPQLEQQRNMERTQLMNQGLVPGGEAYNNDWRLLEQGQNDARLQAAAQAIGLDLAANQQGYSQALGQGQFANQAAGQQFGQNLQAGQFANQAAGQQFGQNLQAGQFGNQAVAQNQQAMLAQQAAQNAAQQQAFAQQFGVQGLQNQAIGQNQGAALSQQQAQNAAQMQAFNQALQGGQFGNQAQQQALQQALYQRNLPLNEITALMSGSQIQNPQFQAYQGQNVAPAPIANAAAQQANYNQGLYNSQVGQQNAFNQGLFSLGAAAMPLFF